MSEKQPNKLKEVIDQAEIMQNKILFAQMFEKNLAFFKNVNSDIYEQFVNYSAKNIWPIFDDAGYVDLYNNQTKEPIFKQDPVEFTENMVNNYLKNAYYNDYRFAAPLLPEEEKRIHAINVSKASQTSSKYDKYKKRFEHIPGAARFMIMKGVGLGYQFEKILDKIDVHYMCIVENNADVFFASLHTLDYDKLFSWFNKSGYGLNIIFDLDENQCMRNIINYALKIGIQNIVRVYEFDYLCSRSLDKSTSAVHKGISEAIGSLGFFDDEIVGLAQSAANFKKKFPILKKSNNNYDIPVFICGNGPSLDVSKDTIQKYANKAIIVSAGSTLGALYKMGIKPDFHIENERVYSILSWVKSSSPKEFREDIQFIGMNVIHPEVIEEFDKVALCLKSNDLGTMCFVTQDGNHDFPTLMYCNPTVTNTAFSTFVNLGFKNFYFFGIDLGFSSDGKHHSSHSQYGEIDKKLYADKEIYDITSKNNIKALGNFSDFCITNRNFFNSKIAFEELISLTKEVNCHNCSQGILIEGAKPTYLEDIDLSQHKTFNKDNFRKALMKEHFTTTYNAAPFEDEQVKENLKPTLKAIASMKELIQRKPGTVEEAYAIMDELDILLKLLLHVPELKYNYFLCKGSLYTFMLLMASALECNLEQGLVEFNELVETLASFLDQAEELLIERPLEFDTMSHEIAEALNPK